MSDLVSALNGATYQGFVEVKEVGLRGMITLRGDLASVDIKNVATGLGGVDFPGQGECNWVGDRGIAWMSPDEVLVMVPYAEVGAAVKTAQNALRGQHHLVVDVSDARAVFEVSGAGLREVLAKLAPVDMSPVAFPAGHFRRTRLAQVPAAFWLGDDDTAQVICFRSVAQYVFDILSDAARPGGEVGLYQ